MFEVRIHGRRGQGVLAAAEMLAIAASLEGRHAQALPGFGAERTAGEVVACCRISEYGVSHQEPITRPDAVIIGEHALLDQASVLDGLRDDGYLLVNSGQRIDSLPLLLRPGCPCWSCSRWCR
jgi:pyruvate ferredoxin oxidoreductase gamma subunit